MALKAEEINLLVYRYLQESGHLHSAFTFAYESLVTQSEIAKMYADKMPPGALISIIQKGLMYLKVEENMDADILKCSTDPICSIKSSTELSILDAIVLQGITKSKSIKYSKWYVKHDKNRNEDEDEEVESRTIGKRKRIGICMAPNATQRIDISKKHTSEMEGSEISLPHLTKGTSFPDIQSTGVTEEQVISSEDVLILTGHEAEVFCCSWHPSDELLASGSGDSTVRLWNLPDDKTTANLKIKSPLPRVLECIAPMSQEKKSTSAGDDHDVTTLEWSVDGSLLATGCMDGIARLWSREGILRHSLDAHSESIFSLRFDAAGKRLLTGSYDKCVSVWDVSTGKLQHKFESHSAQVLDVDWKPGGYHGHDVFASCSTDRTIAVCALADRETDTDPAATTTTPLQVLVGHADEVNAIRWDPSGGLLASCSDDHQVLIWQLGQSSALSMINSKGFCYPHPCLGPSLFIGSVITPRRYTQFVGHRLAKARICPMHP